MPEAMPNLKSLSCRVLDLDKIATQEPWNAHYKPHGRYESGDWWQVWSKDGVVADPEDEATARLIAEYRSAAPELARAYVALHVFVTEAFATLALSRSPNKALEVLRKALEGGPHGE